MEDLDFGTLFFEYYDRAISCGITTFSKMGIDKEDFTRLCVDSEFCLDEKSVLRAAAAMELSQEEKAKLLSTIARK